MKSLAWSEWVEGIVRCCVRDDVEYEVLLWAEWMG